MASIHIPVSLENELKKMMDDKQLDHSLMLKQLMERRLRRESRTTLEEAIEFYRDNVNGNNVFTAVVRLHGLYHINVDDFDYGEVYGESYKILNVAPISAPTYRNPNGELFLFSLLLHTDWPPEIIYRLLYPLSQFSTKHLLSSPRNMYEFHYIKRGDRIVNKQYNDESINLEDNKYTYFRRSNIYNYIPTKTIKDVHAYLIMQDFCLKIEGSLILQLIEIKSILDFIGVECIEDSAKKTYYDRSSPENAVMVIKYGKGDNLMQCKNFIAWNILQKYIEKREERELPVFVLNLLTKHLIKTLGKLSLSSLNPFLVNTCMPKYRKTNILHPSESGLYKEFPEKRGLVDCISAEFSSVVDSVRGVSRASRSKKKQPPAILTVNEYFDRFRYNVDHNFFGEDMPEDAFMNDFISLVNVCKELNPTDPMTGYLNTYTKSPSLITASIRDDDTVNPFGASLFETSQQMVNMFIGDNKIMIFAPSCSCTKYYCPVDCETIERLHTPRSKIARGKTKKRKPSK